MSFEKNNPFRIWEEGAGLDSKSNFEGAAVKFKDAAAAFYDRATAEEAVAKAYYEYSTLMDAYERIESGRLGISENRFDEGLACFSRSSEILRSTLHYGYVAPYASACASLEVTDTLERSDPECLEGYRNAIALFEQSKIALGFQDESHPVIKVIDSYILYCVSQALHVEALEMRRNGEDARPSDEKEMRSKKIRQEFKAISLKSGVSDKGFLYLPVMDYKRALEGAFIVSYPDASGLSLLNIGKNSAGLHSVGNLGLGGMVIEPGRSKKVNSEELGKGRIKVSYEDAETKKNFVEGCLLVI